LLADTGAGARRATFELVLDEADCLVCGGNPLARVTLSGAYVGRQLPAPFPTYAVPVLLPGLGFVQNLRAVGVPSTPKGFEGIACFRFLNRFTYGNFGDVGQFGLER
jgi:hypothetical protein